MDLAINLDGNSSTPLRRQLYEELRQAILTGKLRPDRKIPSTRSLAKSLQVSRTTVTECYEQLIGEGYLQAIVGSGTFVSSQLPDDLLKSNLDRIEIDRTNQNNLSIQLSTYGNHLAKVDLPGIKTFNAPISFRYGRPAFDRFPFQIWRKLFSRHCNLNVDLLDYSSDLLGHQPLREAISNYLKISRGVNCEPDRILITNGSQQGINLVTNLLIDSGDAIALEDPGYLGARRIFQMQRAKLIPIPVDELGLMVDKLKEFTNLKFVYLNPSHQFPTGAVLSLSRRLELLSWAQQKGTILIEDDYDSEYRYSSRPIPALQGLDRHNLVIYIGTFSKVLFPSLRIGYLVLPQYLVKVFASARWLADRQTPAIEQQVLADFINEGYLERHIRQMRQLYDRRRQTLVRSLKNYLGEKVQILGDNAGIHLMAKIDSHFQDEEIIQAADKLGVGLVSTQTYYLQGQYRGQFLFGYAELNEEQIEEGIRRLSQVFV